MREERKTKKAEAAKAQHAAEKPYEPFASRNNFDSSSSANQSASRDTQAQVSSPSMKFNWQTVTKPKSARKHNGGSRLAGPALHRVGASRLNT